MNNRKRSIPRDLLPALLAAAFFATALAGCNTISGVGEDVEAAGGAIEREAKEEKRY